jgi:hypothetical protein
MRPRPLRRSALAPALALALALGAPPPGEAATPAGTARKAANAAVDAALAGFRAAEKQARRSLDADLAAFEAGLGPVPADPLVTLAALAPPLEAFQRALTAALDAALDAAAADLATAMTDFATATAFVEPFPRDLLLGGGGASDRLRDELRGAAAKSVAKARKRLDGTVPLLRDVGLRATFRLEPPRSTHEQGPNVNGAIPFGAPPLTFDVLIGLSQPVGVQGGALFAGGQCEAALGTVDLEVEGSDGFSAQAAPDAAAGRWGVHVGALDLVDAGGEVLVARQAGGPATTAAVGVP